MQYASIARRLELGAQAGDLAGSLVASIRYVKTTGCT